MAERVAGHEPRLDECPGARRGARGVACILLAGGLLALSTVDVLVAVMIGALIGAVCIAVKWRGPKRLRRVAVGATATVSAAAVAAALALPVYAQRPAPLIINLTPARKAANASPLGVDRPSFEVLGYVASDYEDTAAGVDADASRVTALAPTSVSLGSKPGTIEVADASDTRMRAHAEGTRALLVVSNYDGTDFNGDRVQALLESKAATSKFISALTSLVARGGWDGAVIDFENLHAATRNSYPALLRSLAGVLGTRTLDVAVPAFTDPSDPDLAAYDLAAIGAAVDRVAWMAYDEHELTTAAGPVASLAWVQKGLDVALAKIPAAKLQLGIASYGYAWRSSGDATEYSARALHTMVASGKAAVHWDAKAGEWTGKLSDGRTVWYSDGRSMAAAAQIALDRKLGGVALWRVGADEPGALDQLPAAAKRQKVGADVLHSRAVQKHTASPPTVQITGKIGLSRPTHKGHIGKISTHMHF